jgi:hypothetical protein
MNAQDSPELRLLRPKVLTAAGFLGHSGVMQQASLLLRQAATGQVALAADVAKAVYSLAVGSGDAAAYDTVQQMYEQVSVCEGGQGICSGFCHVCAGTGVMLFAEWHSECSCRRMQLLLGWLSSRWADARSQPMHSVDVLRDGLVCWMKFWIGWVCNVCVASVQLLLGRWRLAADVAQAVYSCAMGAWQAHALTCAAHLNIFYLHFLASSVTLA